MLSNIILRCKRAKITHCRVLMSPLVYLQSMLIVEIGCSHAGIQVVAHCLQTFHRGKYFFLVLQYHTNKIKSSSKISDPFCSFHHL